MLGLQPNLALRHRFISQNMMGPRPTRSCAILDLPDAVDLFVTLEVFPFHEFCQPYAERTIRCIKKVSTGQWIRPSEDGQPATLMLNFWSIDVQRYPICSILVHVPCNWNQKMYQSALYLTINKEKAIMIHKTRCPCLFLGQAIVTVNNIHSYFHFDRLYLISMVHREGGAFQVEGGTSM